MLTGEKVGLPTGFIDQSVWLLAVLVAKNVADPFEKSKYTLVSSVTISNIVTFAGGGGGGHLAIGMNVPVLEAGSAQLSVVPALLPKVG
jgi:hypothetical protein